MGTMRASEIIEALQLGLEIDVVLGVARCASDSLATERLGASYALPSDLSYFSAPMFGSEQRRQLRPAQSR